MQTKPAAHLAAILWVFLKKKIFGCLVDSLATLFQISFLFPGNFFINMQIFIFKSLLFPCPSCDYMRDRRWKKPSSRSDQISNEQEERAHWSSMSLTWYWLVTQELFLWLKRREKINHPRNIGVYRTMYSKQPEKSQVFHFKGVGKLSSANARKLGTLVERKKYVFWVFSKGE